MIALGKTPTPLFRSSSGTNKNKNYCYRTSSKILRCKHKNDSKRTKHTIWRILSLCNLYKYRDATPKAKILFWQRTLAHECRAHAHSHPSRAKISCWQIAHFSFIPLAIAPRLPVHVSTPPRNEYHHHWWLLFNCAAGNSINWKLVYSNGFWVIAKWLFGGPSRAIGVLFDFNASKVRFEMRLAMLTLSVRSARAYSTILARCDWRARVHQNLITKPNGGHRILALLTQ